MTATQEKELARQIARMTQIMNLNHLAPDIQEELLCLPGVTGGRAPVHEKGLREVAALFDWREQRRVWLDARRLQPWR